MYECALVLAMGMHVRNCMHTLVTDVNIHKSNICIQLACQKWCPPNPVVRRALVSMPQLLSWLDSSIACPARQYLSAPLILIGGADKCNTQCVTPCLCVRVCSSPAWCHLKEWCATKLVSPAIKSHKTGVSQNQCQCVYLCLRRCVVRLSASQSFRISKNVRRTSLVSAGISVCVGGQRTCLGYLAKPVCHETGFSHAWCLTQLVSHNMGVSRN